MSSNQGEVRWGRRQNAKVKEDILAGRLTWEIMKDKHKKNAFMRSYQQQHADVWGRNLSDPSWRKLDQFQANVTKCFHRIKGDHPPPPAAEIMVPDEATLADDVADDSTIGVETNLESRFLEREGQQGVKPTATLLERVEAVVSALQAGEIPPEDPANLAVLVRAAQEEADRLDEEAAIEEEFAVDTHAQIGNDLDAYLPVLKDNNAAARNAVGVAKQQQAQAENGFEFFKQTFNQTLEDFKQERTVAKKRLDEALVKLKDSQKETADCFRLKTQTFLAKQEALKERKLAQARKKHVTQASTTLKNAQQKAGGKVVTFAPSSDAKPSLLQKLWGTKKPVVPNNEKENILATEPDVFHDALEGPPPAAKTEEGPVGNTPKKTTAPVALEGAPAATKIAEAPVANLKTPQKKKPTVARTPRSLRSHGVAPEFPDGLE